MGLLVAECARALGAGRVLVVGRGARLEKAASLGHETIDFTAEDTVVAIRERTGPRRRRGARVLGRPRRRRPGRRGGAQGRPVAAIGIPPGAGSVPLRRLVLDEVEVVGVRAAAGEMPEAIALVAAGKIALRELVTHRFALEDYAEAYRVFTERVDGALKVIVRP